MENYSYPIDNQTFTDLLISGINHQLSIKNWSLKILSDKSGLPYETIKKLAGGKIKNPSFYSVYRVAHAFDCSVDTLLGEENPAQAQVSCLSQDVKRLRHILNDMDIILDHMKQE